MIMHDFSPRYKTEILYPLLQELTEAAYYDFGHKMILQPVDHSQ